MKTKLQILGSGCARCKSLTERAETAAKELGLDYEVEKITDVNEMMKFDILATPALAVNGQVKLSGRIPTVEEVKKLLA